MTEVQKLHIRATRGEVLSIEELAKLEAWYKQQDEAEAKQLLSASSSLSTTILQEQTASVMKQLETTAQHIQETLQANEVLRQKIAALEQELAKSTVSA
jgi:translation initiation factor 6 (eIF-6)